MGVKAQWLKFSLNEFHEQFKIREICEIKDPRNISTIRYAKMHTQWQKIYAANNVLQELQKKLEGGNLDPKEVERAKAGQVGHTTPCRLLSHLYPYLSPPHSNPSLFSSPSL